MPELRLKLEGGETSLDVRQFSATESLSELFVINLMARSQKASVDLENIIGRGASLWINGGIKHLGDGIRLWTGVVSSVEQTRAEVSQKGESTYNLTIVPRLWLLTQRADYRVFQHKSVPAIVNAILADWKIACEWKVDDSLYPQLEYRAQYGETDYAFIRRLLDEAGIVYTFPDQDKTETFVLFNDALEKAEPKVEAIPFVDNPNQTAEKAFVTDVQLVYEVRPGAYALRDFDFRKPAFQLVGEAPTAKPPEDRLEHYDYRPGSFVAETGKDKSTDTPAADDKGQARHDPDHGKRRAAMLLEAERADRREISFGSNTVDLWPGAVFQMARHPHPALSSKHKLLVTELTIDGSAEDEWKSSGTAIFAEARFRPRESEPKPVVHGTQSAVVVGPAGEEIHTDEFGRVRVQFPWDRYGKLDDQSSCWIRVSQGWAGTGYGLLNLPRVGQEVLVAFLQGDPDQPIIVGRVFNAVQQVPYKLPDHKTRSTWRSHSSPGGGGFNEITLEDKSGKEVMFVQAEKDRRLLVKNDDVITVGRDRRKVVGHDETETTKNNRTEVTGNNRIEITDQDHTTVVGSKRATLIGGDDQRHTMGAERVRVEKDQHLIVKGERREFIRKNSHLIVEGERREQVYKSQSLLVEGDRHERVGKTHAVRAGEEIHLHAGDKLVVEANQELTVKGPGGFIRIDTSGVTVKGKMVFINSGSAQPGVGQGASPIAPKKAKRVRLKTPDAPEIDDVRKNNFADARTGKPNGNSAKSGKVHQRGSKKKDKARK